VVNHTKILREYEKTTDHDKGLVLRLAEKLNQQKISRWGNTVGKTSFTHSMWKAPFKLRTAAGFDNKYPEFIRNCGKKN
jgi:hypothetical protein